MSGLNPSKAPPISVLMGVYNTEEAFLREAIESILNQTFKDFEFIIVLDGPTDDSAAVVRSYHDDRIIVLENERNIGLAKSLNKGLAFARGRYIARMDADDVSLTQRFEKQFFYMEAHPDVDVLGTSILCFGDGKVQNINLGMRDDNNIIKARMLFFNAGPAHPTAFIRRSFLEKHSMRYDEGVGIAEDYKLWLDLVWAGGRICSLQEALLKYRLHEKQITQKVIREMGVDKHTEKVVRMQAEQLLGPINDHDFVIHEAIYTINLDISVEECDAHITRLIKANQQKKLYEPQSFRKVILSIWLLTEFRMLRRFHSTRLLKSKHLLPSLAPSVVFHTVKWKLRG